MSNNGYIKLNRCKEFDELVENHPLSSLLLSVIARRAKRDCEFSALGLSQAQCFINHKCCGLTERQYRTAKDKLTELKFVKFITTTDKKTIATLLDSRIYDINLEGARRTTDGRNDGRNDGQKIILNNLYDTSTNDISLSKKEFATDETTDETTVKKNCIKKNKEQTDSHDKLKEFLSIIKSDCISIDPVFVVQLSEKYKNDAIAYALDQYVNDDKTKINSIKGYLISRCQLFNKTKEIMNENTIT